MRTGEAWAERDVVRADLGLRPLRRCARCGREGRNAYRPMRGAATAELWLCTHAEPCLERTRLLQRASAKRAHGRPPQSPISGWSLEDRRIVVVGGDEASRTALADLVSDATSAEVDCLALDRRGLDMLSRRECGLVIADVRQGDPIAILDGLDRRLSRIAWRGATVLVVHGPGDEGPAVEAIVRAPNVIALTRPVRPSALVGIISGLDVESPRAKAG